VMEIMRSAIERGAPVKILFRIHRQQKALPETLAEFSPRAGGGAVRSWMAYAGHFPNHRIRRIAFPSRRLVSLCR